MNNNRGYSYDVFGSVNKRWPETGDSLFSVGRDSFFARGAAERNYRLLLGYKRAGDILIQTALSEQFESKNLIFPALFNYRHYIELALKVIIEDHGAFAGVSLGSKNHNLTDLWRLFLEIATAFGNDSSDIVAVAVSKCIDEFARVDAKATAFRYASDLKGNTPIFPHDGIDLLRLHDVMNGIANFFECVDLDFSHKAEMAAEEL